MSLSPARRDPRARGRERPGTLRLGPWTPGRPRVPARAAAPAGHSKSSECFECGKIFRTYHQMVLHSRVHRRARRHREGPGERVPRARCGSLSEGDSASQPSSPGSACAAVDSPGSGLADEAADESGEEGTAHSAPGERVRPAGPGAGRVGSGCPGTRSSVPGSPLPR